MPDGILRLAVLIDADNASAAIIGDILSEVATFGTATIKRIYGDFTTSNLNSWRAMLAEHAIQPIQQFRNTVGKNASDSALIIDAMDLERLTKALDEAPGDESGGEMVEGLEDVETSLVADDQPAEAAEPGQGAFHDPAMPSQTLRAFDAAPGDPRLDGALAQRPAALREIIALVGMQLGRSPAGPSPTLAYRRHGINQDFKEAAVVDVCRGEPDGKRDALCIGDEVSLRSGSAAIGRIGAGLLAPLLAGTDALSTQARLQSMAPARPSRSSRTRCSLSHTPAACQSRSRRQQVIPDPQPISCGSISHGKPLFRTNRMPLSAARCGTGGRPPFGFARSGGSSGSIRLHNSSGRRGLAMSPTTARPHRRSRFC